MSLSFRSPGIALVYLFAVARTPGDARHGSRRPADDRSINSSSEALLIKVTRSRPGTSGRSIGCAM